MTHQAMDRFTNAKHIPSSKQAILQHARRSLSNPPKFQPRGVANVKHNEVSATLEENMIAQIEALVVSGRQKDITDFFSGWNDVPVRVGEWKLSVNHRRQDNVIVSRTIVATPLTVRSRNIFERGSLANLVSMGFSPEDASFYYRAAYRKSYVWIDVVKEAVLEMINSFQTITTLESFQRAGDPRALAKRVAVPKNPYCIGHMQFLVAIEMAICVINSRNAAAKAKAAETSATLN